MKLKPLAIAAIALLLPLSACGTGGDTEPAESSVSSPAAPAGDQPTGVPQVDRDPQGDLPAIAFDDKSIPTMEPIDGEAPTQITVKTLKQGDGETVGEGAFVTVNYAGYWMMSNVYFNAAAKGYNPMNGIISLIMLVLGMLILLSALRKWSELWKLRQQPSYKVVEATAS